MITELRQAIYNLGKAITGINSNFHFEQAPESTRFPYCVFSKVAGSITRDTAGEFREEYFQVNTYATTLTEAELIESRVSAKFKNAETTLNNLITTNKIYSITHQSDTQLKNGQVYQITQQFLIKLYS